MSMTNIELKSIRKAQDKQRSGVKKTCQRITMQFQINRLKTWNDLYHITGYDEQYIKSTFPSSDLELPVSIKDIKNWCNTLTNELEKAILKQDFGGTVEKAVVKPVETVPSATATPKSTTTPPAPSSNVTSNPSTEEQESNDGNNDYGLEKSPKESGFLFWFQKKASKEILDKITVKKLPAVLLVATTGAGKTFIDAAVDRRLKDRNFDEGKTWGPTKTLLVTRASIVEQSKRVLHTLFGIMHPVDTEVVNIEKLRTRVGEFWISSYTTIEGGEEVDKYEWKQMINPCRIRWDECQALKNEDSIQSKIAVAYTKCPNVTQLFMSATPFARVSDARTFAIATGKDISNITGIAGQKLNEGTWPTYAALIAAPADPKEYNEASMERLMKDLDDYIVQVKGVRWQFNAMNGVEYADFDAPERRAEYDQAWQMYLNQMALLKKDVTENPVVRMWIERERFLMAAEYAKRYIFAERIVEKWNRDLAPCLALKYKRTVISVVKILNEKYGWHRDMMSLIWGGGQTQMTAKEKLKKAVVENAELFKQQGITLEDMGLDTVGDRILEELPEHLRLGNQSLKERQFEIDRFQAGKSRVCIFTFKAGGAGLSLHHCDERVPQKVRRKKSGYAIEEDIPKIPTRPRDLDASTTWSPFDAVQVMGRCPRITSLSDTKQSVVLLRGTIEEEQGFVLAHKLRCLAKAVKNHENWMDIIDRHTEAAKVAKELVEKTKQDEQDGPQIITDSLLEDENEKEEGEE